MVRFHLHEWKTKAPLLAAELGADESIPTFLSKAKRSHRIHGVTGDEASNEGSRRTRQKRIHSGLTSASDNNDGNHLGAFSQCTYRALLDGRVVEFEPHDTGKDGSCGFYALPIADNRDGVKRMLLEASSREDIRDLAAFEICDAAMSGSLPPELREHPF